MCIRDRETLWRQYGDDIKAATLAAGSDSTLGYILDAVREKMQHDGYTPTGDFWKSRIENKVTRHNNDPPAGRHNDPPGDIFIYFPFPANPAHASLSLIHIFIGVPSALYHVLFKNSSRSFHTVSFKRSP